MKTFSDVSYLRKKKRPILLAAGFFDGVHRGHRRVIETTVSAARRARGEAWVLTFDPHPAKVLRPGSAPRLLTSTPHKVRLLTRLGVDGCLLMSFSRELAGLSPAAFVGMLHHLMPTLKTIFVGKGWRFGKGQAGDSEMLATLAAPHGVGVTVVGLVYRRGVAVSSTRIRALVARGRLREAADMLGRPYSLLGRVVKGRSVGRALGFPTANLETENEVLPPFGVYAVRARVGDRLLDGVLALGRRPTFRLDRAPATVELHLLDFSGRLYGREIEVFFIRKLRPERRFPSVSALVRQIGRDVRNARKENQKNRFTF